MNPACCCLLMVLAATIEGGQHRTISVEPGKRIEVDVPGALMAFARDYSNASVLAEDGEILILAKKPGKTEIVVITGSEVVKFDLLVTGERRRIATSTLVPIRPEPLVNDEAVINPSELKGTTSTEEGPARVVAEEQAADGTSNGERRMAEPSRGQQVASTAPRKVPASAQPKIIARNPPAEPITTEPSHAQEPPTSSRRSQTLRERDIPPETRKKEQVPLTGEATEPEQSKLTESNLPPATQSKPIPVQSENIPGTETSGETQGSQSIPAAPRAHPNAPPSQEKAHAPNPTTVSPKPRTAQQPGGEQQPAPVSSDDVEGRIEPRIPDETVEVKSTFQEVPVSPLGLFNNFIQLREGRATALQIPGLTAAVSDDPNVVDVVVSRETLTVFGKSPGHADILVMTSDGTRIVPVEITRAPPIFPHGFVAPVSERAENETGEYEFRFNSDRDQIQNRLHFTVHRPGRTTELGIVTTKFLDTTPGYNSTTLPSAYYRITTPGWKVGLLDEMVNNSPLTVNQSILRGLHLDIGRWTLHAGYSPTATFDNFLVPTQRELAGGLGYTEDLTEHSHLTESFYYFHLPDESFNVGRSGGVGSIVYRLQRPDGWDISAELGFSRGLAGSGEIQFRNAKDFLDATFQTKPQNFPALTIGNLPGTVYGVTWNHNLTPKLMTDLNIFGNHLILPNSEQSNLTEAADVIYRFTPNWSVNPGEVYAHFSQSSAAGNYSIRTLSFPQQINFDTSHFGASVQYQPTLTSGGYALGQSIRGTSRLTFGSLQLSGYAERQTQALSISSILSQIPALQLELQRLGITISNPQQLSSLLQDTAFLQTLGLSQGASLHIVPVRRQVGGNFSWTSHAARPQQLVLDYVRTTDELLQGSVRNWVQSGSYTHPIGRTNEVFFSYSWFHYPGLNRQYAPLAEVGFRHTFNSLPSFLDPIRHGTVTGIVYLDEQRKGIYGPALPPLEAVEVVLDGVNNTRTDRAGRYAFSGVARGTHTVEVHFRADHPFWFTSPSTTSADINSVVNFGITFAASELIGLLKNDAGAGVPDVEVDVLGPEQNFKVKSDADGRFALAGLAPGDYTLSIDADSVTPGYVLDEFKPTHVQLEKGVPRKAELLLRAVRSFSGEVLYYNTAQGAYIPLVNGSVTIPNLALHTRTRGDGTFEFTELPAGDYTVLLSGGSSSMTRVITIPTGPAHLKEVFRIPASK